MELALQDISIDKTVKSNKTRDLTVSSSQSSGSQAEKGKQLVSMSSAINKILDILGDDIYNIYNRII